MLKSLFTEQFQEAKNTFLMACKKSPTCVSWLGVGMACYRVSSTKCMAFYRVSSWPFTGLVHGLLQDKYMAFYSVSLWPVESKFVA